MANLDKKELFIVDCENARSKANKAYLKLTVRDKEKVNSTVYVWKKINEFLELYPKNRVFFISADFESPFPSMEEFIISNSDISAFVYRPFPSDEYAMRLLNSLIEKIGKDDEEISTLLLNVFDEETKVKFILAPAARKHHHNYHGGLLEHTLEVVKFCSKLLAGGDFITSCDNKVLLAGALLHDIGKVRVYQMKDDTPVMTKQLYISDHVAEGALMVAQHYLEDIPSRIQHIIHIILSHHRQLEWGSPVAPATKEANLVHLADYWSMVMNKANNVVYDEEGIGSSSEFKEKFLKF